MMFAWVASSFFCLKKALRHLENFSQKGFFVNSLPLFMEDIYDALRAAIQASGGPKSVAGRLWPHKPIDQAKKELLDALNRDNPRKLDNEEFLAVLKMAKEAGFHQAKHWIDGELGYDPTPMADPHVQRDRLAEELGRALDVIEGVSRAAQRLNVDVPISLLKRNG